MTFAFTNMIFSKISAAGIRRTFDYWSEHLTLRTIYQQKSEQYFCQDTVQTYSCITVQFTEAYHLELVIERTQRPRYSMVS